MTTSLRNIRARCRHFMTIGLLCTVVLAFPARADFACVPANAHADLQLLGLFGPVAGTAYFEINGEPAVAEVFVRFLGLPKLNPDGTLGYLARIDYDFGGGNTIVGIAVGRLVSTGTTGIFDNIAKVTYVDGTGIYATVLARFQAVGTINFLARTATQKGIGDICRPTTDDDGGSDSD